MDSEGIEFSKLDERLFSPSESFSSQSHIKSEDEYKKLYNSSINDGENFWGDIAENFIWREKWDRVLNKSEAPFFKWFDGGKLNITESILEKNCRLNPKKTAIIWEGENSSEQKQFTYQELFEKVNLCANTLRSFRDQ